MKSFTILLSLVTLSLGAWLDEITAEAGQIPMAYEYTSFPGVDINLASKCLVQVEDGKPPIWMTELEKVCGLLTSIRTVAHASVTTDPCESPGYQLLRYVCRGCSPARALYTNCVVAPVAPTTAISAAALG